MDRFLPLMDGLEATRRLREMAEMRDVLIVSVSASVADEDEQRVLEAGHDAFLPKPVELERLLRLLGSHLDLRWKRSEPGEPEAEDAGPIIPPSPEEMRLLLELAERGDMRRVRERALALERADEKLKPFGRKLRRLADALETGAVLSLIQRYTEHRP
jgi:CheY-like chemotaxis protein